MSSGRKTQSPRKWSGKEPQNDPEQEAAGRIKECIAGHGYLSLGQAVHVAQNSEAGVDERLAQHLERHIAEIWPKLNAQPASYILPPDEFALLNFYRTRFGDHGIVKNAATRFWANNKGSGAQ
jgi:hypothetical protein